MRLPEGLGELRFFQGLPAGTLELLGSLAEGREVPGRGVVFREGEPSTFVHVVVAGRVALEINVPGRGAVAIHTIGPGELLGWSPLLGPGPMTATARAVVPSRLVSLHAPQLLALCEHNPALGLELMRRTARALAQRLGATRLQLLDVYRNELPAAGERGHA
jgi:CRP-like cAMP-binding protein